MSPTYRKSQHAKHLRRSLSGVKAREAKRLASATDAGTWPLVGNFLLSITAAPDGRNMGLQVWGAAQWYKVGTHRACCAWMARQVRKAIERRANQQEREAVCRQ